MKIIILMIIILLLISCNTNSNGKSWSYYDGYDVFKEYSSIALPEHVLLSFSNYITNKIAYLGRSDEYIKQSSVTQYQYCISSNYLSSKDYMDYVLHVRFTMYELEFGVYNGSNGMRYNNSLGGKYYRILDYTNIFNDGKYGIVTKGIGGGTEEYRFDISLYYVISNELKELYTDTVYSIPKKMDVKLISSNAFAQKIIYEDIDNDSAKEIIIYPANIFFNNPNEPSYDIDNFTLIIKPNSKRKIIKL